MLERAKRHGLALRPHGKTHQSAEISRMMLDAGIDETSVTSLRMAESFADHGWKKITIAMPANPGEFPAMVGLAKRVDLSLFLVDAGVAAALSASEELPELSYFIEVDAGYGRSGVAWRRVEEIRTILEAAGRHRFRGFYVHSGHTYATDSVEEISAIHQELLHRIQSLRTVFSDFPFLEVAIGDTPSTSTQENFGGVTSIGPGNFIYYDLVQHELGACGIDDIAICTSVPVLQIKPERNEVIVHGGWVQLGRDSLVQQGRKHFGLVVELDAHGEWDAHRIVGHVAKISQEHGTLIVQPEVIERIAIGDHLGVLPVHACAAVS